MTDQPHYAYDLFISYAQSDRAWVNGYLVPALGLPSERSITHTDFTPGAPVVTEFERAVTSSRYSVLVLSSAYLADEWTIYSELLTTHASVSGGQQRLIPLLLHPCELPLRVDFRVRLDCTDEANWEAEVARLRALLDRPEPALEHVPCPYPGMRAFTEAEGDHFCGREDEIEELLHQLRKHPFATVIGPSGSGKSSLVYAGLLPRLHRSYLLGGADWHVYDMRPGLTPLSRLRALPIEEESQHVGANVLLIVDQFEETFSQAGEEAAPFQAALLDLLQASGVYLMLTVRADFYPELMGSPLWPEIRAHRLEVLPLDADGLRQAIARPAEAMGAYVDPALVERVVNDAAGEPGILPFLQETLVLMWGRLERRYLPLRALVTS